MGWSEISYARCGEETKLLPLRGIELRFPGRLGPSLCHYTSCCVGSVVPVLAVEARGGVEV